MVTPSEFGTANTTPAASAICQGRPPLRTVPSFNEVEPSCVDTYGFDFDFTFDLAFAEEYGLDTIPGAEVGASRCHLERRHRERCGSESRAMITRYIVWSPSVFEDCEFAFHLSALASCLA